MNILFVGLTLSVIGKVMVVLAVLHMHSWLIREHKIDRKVVLSYQQERYLTFLGMILIVMGYCLQIYFYGLTPLLSCEHDECAAALIQSVSN
jgi:hypothetical protein